MTEDLELFGKKDAPDYEHGWKLYERAREFNTAFDLEDIVRVNENFYIGKQWEGVEANGLPTPQINILKRIVGFSVATITTDNIKVNATALDAAEGTEGLSEAVDIVNREFERLTERLSVVSLLREYARNSAVDGDGCMYTYWDADADAGFGKKGAIKTEIVENTRVFFGNPNDRQVQTQPWIIISKRELVRAARRTARDNGIENYMDIVADTDDNMAVDSAKQVTDDDKVTDLLLLWRSEETGTIWAYEFTKNCTVKKPVDTKIKLYPVCWINWDYIQDSYHGQAMITGLIPNQIFINKIWAMSMVSLMRTAYPKVVYDKSRIAKWDNRVGAAIGINGGDVDGIAKIIDPATISPQISQFIQLVVEQTEESLGATSVALGDTRPDNTSAIIALQRAAATPSELTKQNLYKSVEDLYRIYLEFMAEYYGTRKVVVPVSDKLRKELEERSLMMAQQQAAMGLPIPSAPPEIPDRTVIDFNFTLLRDHPMLLKLEAGASSYYSEIVSTQTLDNLLQLRMITLRQYLERIPDGNIPARRSLIAEIKKQESQEAQLQQAAQMQAQQPQGGGNVGEAIASGGLEDIPSGRGYSQLQRKINETGSAAGLV